MLDNFLNQTGKIEEITQTIVSGEAVKTKTVIYTGVKCYYYKTTAKLNNTNLAENTQIDKYKVILEPDKILIRTGMFITVEDPDFGEVGVFEIESVKMNRLINGKNDSVELTIKSI